VFSVLPIILSAYFGLCFRFGKDEGCGIRGSSGFWVGAMGIGNWEIHRDIPPFELKRSALHLHLWLAFFLLLQIKIVILSCDSLDKFVSPLA
jgi:hypothetical protein